MTKTEPPVFNRNNFITLNNSRLFTAKDVCNIIREYCPECERPRTPQKMPNSTELLAMANTEWENREARKGNHDRASWVSGWLNGYFAIRQSLSLKQKPGCYATCPFNDLCANDIDKIRAIEDTAAITENTRVLDDLDDEMNIRVVRANAEQIKMAEYPGASAGAQHDKLAYASVRDYIRSLRLPPKQEKK